MINDRYPDTFGDVFTGTQKRGNPWNQHPSSRLEWAKRLPVRTMAEIKEAGETVQYLLWVGCSAAFDARNQKIARSLVQILCQAGVSFGVLGEEESPQATRRVEWDMSTFTRSRLGRMSIPCMNISLSAS